MKALVGAFNQEKALVGVGAFSVIVTTGCGTDGSFYSTSPRYPGGWMCGDIKCNRGHIINCRPAPLLS